MVEKSKAFSPGGPEKRPDGALGSGLMHPERTCPCDDDFLPGLWDKEECSQLATEQLPGGLLPFLDDLRAQEWQPEQIRKSRGPACLEGRCADVPQALDHHCLPSRPTASDIC